MHPAQSQIAAIVRRIAGDQLFKSGDRFLGSFQIGKIEALLQRRDPLQRRAVRHQIVIGNRLERLIETFSDGAEFEQHAVIVGRQGATKFEIERRKCFRSVAIDGAAKVQHDFRCAIGRSGNQRLPRAVGVERVEQRQQRRVGRCHVEAVIQRPQRRIAIVHGGGQTRSRLGYTQIGQW